MSYVENLFSLDGKVAIVTGAARGNGKAIAEALLRAGATVILVDILEEKLVNITAALKSRDLNAVPFVCDVTDQAQLQRLIEFVKNSHKRIDILVNNAGVTFSHELFDYPDEAWEKTYRVNLKAPFELSKDSACSSV